MAWNSLDLAGQTFGRLTVVAAEGRTAKGQIAWRCQCVCGGSAKTTSTKLRSGHTGSCGCLQAERTAKARRKHGYFEGGRHPLTDCYSGMIDRCRNPKNNRWHRYGGRGIRVCDRWMKGEDGKTGFQCFVDDVGARPLGMTLDRKDNDGNYEPTNIRWATPKQQAQNRS